MLINNSEFIRTTDKFDLPISINICRYNIQSFIFDKIGFILHLIFEFGTYSTLLSVPQTKLTKKH